jgi:hypothetical protein
MVLAGSNFDLKCFDGVVVEIPGVGGVGGPLRTRC